MVQHSYLTLPHTILDSCRQAITPTRSRDRPMTDTRQSYLCVAIDDNGQEIRRSVRKSSWGEKGAVNGFRAELTEAVLLSETARIDVTPVVA